MDLKPQVISSVERFHGRVFRLRSDEVQFEDGARTTLDVIEHPGSYGIIATPAPDSLVLVKQYRHAVGRELWEIPAGTAERGESPVEGARRELAEETGYRAEDARHLGTLFMTPGFCNEFMYFIHFWNLHEGEQSLDEDERITVGTFTLDRAESLVKMGQIADIKTVLALLWMRGNRGELTPVGADN